ncbi:MAG TPA: phytanoyl-CoA dioxygenase family protein [Pyrinomonadaceae bacterium]|nr:phytanoyl-CoA dioxygenase family protein [Pyrinomonadaceae bacterium]
MADDQTFRFYGIKETNTATSEVDRHVEEISISGFTVVTGVIDESELPEVRRRVDQVYEKQLNEIGGAENLRQINDELIARCLLAYDDYFLTVATSAKIIALLRRLLGDYFTLLQQNAVINLPDRISYQTSWHRDLIYQHFIPSRPIAVSALICLDDFSKETGGTHLLPGTHKLEKFPSQVYVQQHELAVNAKAGSAIVFDSMLFHRGGVNTSPNPRRGLNHLYSLPFIKQQIDMPRTLNGKYAEDDFLRKFLGYESQPADSVIEWRSKRLKAAEHK